MRESVYLCGYWMSIARQYEYLLNDWGPGLSGSSLSLEIVILNCSTLLIATLCMLVYTYTCVYVCLCIHILVFMYACVYVYYVTLFYICWEFLFYIITHLAFKLNKKTVYIYVFAQFRLVWHGIFYNLGSFHYRTLHTHGICNLIMLLT